MTILLILVTFVAGMATTIALEIAELHALLEPLRQPIEMIMGIRS